jgi:hypothetical protein
MAAGLVDRVQVIVAGEARVDQLLDLAGCD